MEVTARHVPQGYSPAQPKAQRLCSHRGACGDKLSCPELLLMGIHWFHLQWSTVCHCKCHARRTGTGLQEQASPCLHQPLLPRLLMPSLESPILPPPASLPPASLPPALCPLCSFLPNPPIPTALLGPGCHQLHLLGSQRRRAQGPALFAATGMKTLLILK